MVTILMSLKLLRLGDFLEEAEAGGESSLSFWVVVFFLPPRFVLEVAAMRLIMAEEAKIRGMARSMV